MCAIRQPYTLVHVYTGVVVNAENLLQSPVLPLFVILSSRLEPSRTQRQS